MLDDHHLDSALVYPSPFNHSDIRDWFFSFISVPEPLLTPTLMGSEPFEEGEFDAFLRQSKIEPVPLDPDTDFLVVGRKDWELESVESLMRYRRGDLRIYSQEMYLAFWVTDEDPWASPIEVIRAFRQGHPALEAFRGFLPPFPTTEVPDTSDGNEIKRIFPQIGLLKHMDYRVGANGLPANKRRAILRDILERERLPVVVSAEYMREWGTANSVQRLLKIANSIATFCRNAKRKSRPPESAIAAWDADLNWLRTNFYDDEGWWPNTSN